MNEKPTNITANKKTRELTINWDDIRFLSLRASLSGERGNLALMG